MADPEVGRYSIGTYMSDVEAQKAEWLAPSRLAVGFLTVLDGDPGMGKSTLVADWIARITTGAPIMGGRRRPPGGVVLLSGEDHLRITLRPRLAAAGADLSRVLYMRNVPDIGAFRDQLEPRTHPIGIPSDLPFVEMGVREADAKLLVIDPVMLYFDESVNTHVGASVRRALDPVVEMAERLNVCVLMLRHLNKQGGGPALYRGEGSIGVSGAARIGLLLGRDPQEDRLILACTKNNLAKMPSSIALTLEAAESDADVATVSYGETTGYRADDVADFVSAEEREDRTLCRDWLAISLADQEIEHKDLLKRGSANGFTATQVRVALMSLGAQQVNQYGKRFWRLWAGPEVPWDDVPDEEIGQRRF